MSNHPILSRVLPLALGAALTFGATKSGIGAELPMPGYAPNTANPILPGYYADPSILEHDGRVYIYATLDPWGDKTLGCWESRDCKNWSYRTLNWPTQAACQSKNSGGAAVWAPSVVRGPDRRFHMLVSVGNEVWVGVADHPLGPWSNPLGDRPLIHRTYKPGFHMIDAEYFVDDDGKAYVYWGSGLNWTNGHCFVSRLSPDLSSLVGEDKDVTPGNYFEGPIMVKRHGRYFLMYSNGNTMRDTYQVHYAVGDSPLGPFTEGRNSPILVTDHANQVLSPGHHTILRHAGSDYILYHRQSIPFDPKFIGRQLCVDPILFKPDGTIEKVIPTHEGPSLFQRGVGGRRNLATGAAVTASSQLAGHTGPAHVLDNNYATRWAAAKNATGAWLQLDLGKVTAFANQEIRPEYAWKGMRFLIEASTDGTQWKVIEDFTKNPASGSPIVTQKPAAARFLRLVFPKEVRGSDIALFEWGVYAK